MSSMLPVALKVILISTILYGYYHLFLRNRKFHRYNRYFLLATVILSLGIPFINIDLSFTTEQAESSQVIKTFRDISASAKFSPAQQVTKPVGGNQVDVTQLAAWFFVAIGLILLFRLLFTVKKLYLLYKKHRSEIIDNIVFIHTKAPGTPYSFFRWLFWNDEIEMTSDFGEKIFRHEMYHIKQNHSMDLLFMEILNIICWFNPVYYLVKKEIRAIHEFLADEYAASDTDRNDYAELLLMQTLHTNQRLVNPFFHNLVKRRIMMLVSKKPSLQYARRILVLPVLCLLFGLFAFQYDEHNSEGKKISVDPLTTRQLLFEKKIKLVIKNIDTTGKPLLVLNGIIMDKSLEEITRIIQPNEIESINVLKRDAALIKYGKRGTNGVIEINTRKPDSLPVPEDSKPTRIFLETEMPASFPGGPVKFQEYVNSKKDRMHVSYPRGDEGVLAFSDHLEVTVKFIVHEDGSLSDISASTTEQIGYDAVWLISKGPKWVPAKQNGINVSSWVKQIIKIPWNKVEPTGKVISVISDSIPSPNIGVQELKKATPYQLLLLPVGTPVIRYSFTIDLPDGSIISIPNYGSVFNDQTKSQIQAAQAGRLLTIDNIVISENGKEKKVPSKIWYIVK